jgi:hypothetical protein
MGPIITEIRQFQHGLDTYSCTSENTFRTIWTIGTYSKGKTIHDSMPCEGFFNAKSDGGVAIQPLILLYDSRFRSGNKIQKNTFHTPIDSNYPSNDSKVGIVED